MNNFPKKRTNPFEKPITAQKEEKVAPVIEIEEEIEQPEVEIEEQEEEIEEFIEPAPVVKKQPQKQSSKPVQKSTRTSVRSSNINYDFDENEDRVKYTATMSKKLRRRIKIVCADRDIMFSQFIELACMEKLSREGER